MTTLPKLTIQHNHGVIVLRDVEVTEYAFTNYRGEQMIGQSVTGTPVSGGWTSTLFTARSFKPVDTTKPYTHNIWARPIFQTFGCPEGEYYVDTCTCG
jgi:hypothetical protein